MKHDDFTERLLDAGLREYSRVSPPERFALRTVPARPAWKWALAAALPALAVALLLLRPEPPTAPPAYRVALPPAALPNADPRTWNLEPGTSRPRRPQPAPRRFRELSGAELARMDLPVEFLAKFAVKPLTDLEVPDLNVKPLPGGEEEASGTPKEKMSW
jgi:hypothetical protein